MIETAFVHLDELHPKARTALTLVAARRGITVPDLMKLVLETYADTWEHDLGDVVKERKAS